MGIISIAQGAPYVQTKDGQLKTICHYGQKATRAVDLGSGDGRIAIALAQSGVPQIEGYEINPWLVLLSRQRIKKLGLTHKITIHWQSFWHTDLSSFDLVIVYGIPYIMNRLFHKLASETKPGTIILSNGFPLPTPPQEHTNRIYLYRKDKTW